MEIMKYLKDVNILLVVLDILFLIISFLFMNKKKCNERVKDLFVVFYTLANLFLFSYVNSIFQGIFTLKFLSVKFYLVMVLSSLIIFLYTFNKKMKLFYKVFNYLMVMIIHVILVINVYIVVSNKFEVLDFIDVGNSIALMNISLIIFFSYLGIIGLVYIGYYLFQNKIGIVERKVVIDNSLEIKNVDENMAIEELSKYKVGEEFYINGVDCSIIFCDSNKDNIIKNYNILLSDIEAPLVNGYTLGENIMIKNICDKLSVSNLGNVDLNNFNILNKVDIDEYNFLKKVLNQD